MKIIPAILFAFCLTLAARAADPAPLGEVRVKETAERQYFCAKKDLKFTELHEFAITTIKQLMEKATELKLSQSGPILFTYFNFRGDPEQVFTIEIGVPIHAEKAEGAGAFYVRKVPKFKCASAIFQGSLSGIGEAWHGFAQAAMAKGEPTGENRELYLYWEGHNSPSNIVELQMGLK
ncbi:MAG: GyrI-like domain-containing protein [Chthoniobacteraceae bacterium]